MIKVLYRSPHWTDGMSADGIKTEEKEEGAKTGGYFSMALFWVSTKSNV